MLEFLIPEALVSIWHHVGLMAYPLALCTIVCFAILIERCVFFYTTKPVALSDAIEDINESNHIAYYLGNELKNLSKLSKLHREEIIGIALSVVRKQLFTGSAMLKFIAAISPMFGLLGNVLGMIKSFSAISQSTTGINPAIVSEGLQEAMYTTAVGLGIAIPAMLGEYLIKYFANLRFENYVAYVTQKSVLIEESKSAPRPTMSKTTATIKQGLQKQQKQVQKAAKPDETPQTNT